ncbi:ATP synthase F1 subunit delta [Enterococcus termitis]|jgi:F-type H+-transporting ATPase subunit delta|uniref:ATP synthase subunit delta n=1 Tax=Enterococcus termitis TaxID=332950 RepID=A0A1E5GIH7_9ENTE|nr:ATP synthase F1 subunit delta [Enterococcus termitis]OEG12411.1 F0F1 ATP synthase subunit delta [Enterococcus termitis]
MKLDKYTVGKRYGKALFELAIEKQEADSIYQNLLTLREIFHEVPDLGGILSDVRLEPYEKDEIMNQLIRGFDGTMKNFLYVVYNYSRMNDLLLMIDEYERRYDEYKSLLLGTVLTAVPLSKEQHQQMEEKAAALLGYEQASLINLIDPAIVGGVIIEANHKVIDGSIHKQLERIQELLLK